MNELDLGEPIQFAGEPEGEEIIARFKTSAKRIPRYGRLAANLIRDDRVPLEAKGVLVAGGAYVISPIDLIPGFIPVLGQIDDLLVMLFGLKFALSLCPDDVVAEQLKRVGLQEQDFADDVKNGRDMAAYLGREGLHRLESWAGRGLHRAERFMRNVRKSA